jgi:hypothetical protein
MTATKLAQIIETHSGHITAQNDEGTITRVQFENRLRAGGFYDEMTSRFVEIVEYNPDERRVIVQL